MVLICEVLNAEKYQQANRGGSWPSTLVYQDKGGGYMLNNNITILKNTKITTLY